MQQKIIEDIATTAQYGGAAGAGGSFIFSWLAENHQAITAGSALVCTIVAIAGFCVNWYYKHKNKRDDD